jgi:competence protein ComEC
MYYILKKHRDLLFAIVIVTVLYGIAMYSVNHKTLNNSGHYIVSISKVNEKEDYYVFDGVIDHVKVKGTVDYFDSPYSSGEYECYGNIEQPIHATIPGSFDYSNYLASQNIFYTFKATSCKKIKDKFSVNSITLKIENYIDTHLPYSKAYVKTLILADKSDMTKEVLEHISFLGISHMFAVSGFHVGLLVLVLKKVFTIIKLPSTIKDNTILIFLIFYMVITGMTASITRAVLLFSVLLLKERYRVKISALDILSLLYIINMVNRPYSYYNTGFLLSYFMALILILSQKILRNKTLLQSSFYVSVIAFMSTFPIVLIVYKTINLYTIFYNVIYMFFLSFILLPLVYLAFLFPVLDGVLYKCTVLFETSISILSSIKNLSFSGSITSPIILIILYTLIFIILAKIERQKPVIKYIFLLFTVMFISLNSNKYDITKRMAFLDVYGDATLITDSFDACNILIDTGENDEYDSVINYLKRRDIRRIDYILISHFHTDHYGELSDIQKEFRVSNLITNHNALSYEGQWIGCGSIQFYIYPLKYDYNNENNNSLFILVEFEHKKYLFVGDAEEKREEEFLATYNLDVDVLKVGHHGSSTSSSEPFLLQISPEEAYVMVHRNNRNNHPSSLVISRFKNLNIPIYRTDELGTIEIVYIFEKEIKKYHRP